MFKGCEERRFSVPFKDEEVIVSAPSAPLKRPSVGRKKTSDVLAAANSKETAAEEEVSASITPNTTKDAVTMKAEVATKPANKEKHISTTALSSSLQAQAAALMAKQIPKAAALMAKSMSEPAAVRPMETSNTNNNKSAGLTSIKKTPNMSIAQQLALKEFAATVATIGRLCW